MDADCSLIISTYNWTPALNLCLKSVLKQSVLPAEIIIADDGSTEDTRHLIEKFCAETTVPVIHVWQPDEGFQLAKIRNRAIARSNYPYIIQIDGDLILHTHFIKDHLFIKQPGYFVSGSRVLLSPDTTHLLFQHNSIDIKEHNKGGKIFLNRFRIRFLQKTLSRWYKNSGKHKYYVKGCNMAFWKKDLETVNGYNESFTGWGKEDSELAIRLINAGIKKKFLKMGGITFHLFHKEAARSMELRNIDLMNEAIRLKQVIAKDGLNKYLNSA